MPAEIVFAAYRPKPGKGEALLALVRRHQPALRAAGLVTDRPVVVVRAEDGTLIEVFEWTSAEAARRAHDLPEVRAIWGPMEEVAEFATLASLAEAQHPFPHFTPVA